ncbi:E3 ubiquitin-protein ligase COP1-like isoform X2 [Silene latifolia]|uniref:E3 ubiquitin-protein ligase COP1-like isoform X2 n=1 Tax=Silene latifolia TaxID=37657 RepID=UPI003D78785C
MAEPPIVPTIKSDSDTPPPPPTQEISPATNSAVCGGDDDGDVTCPICMQMIKDAFLTACGHSYCYMCIVTHLRNNKSDCPCCGRFLTPNLIFPNFALDKLLKKMSDRQFIQSASSMDQLRRALQKGCDISVKDLDSMLSLLAEKKRKMEQEEAETNLQILLEFLVYLRKRKLEELSEVQNDLRYIKEDLQVIQKRSIDLSDIKGRCNVRVRVIDDDSNTMDICPPVPGSATDNCAIQDQIAADSSHCKESFRLDAPLFSKMDAVACSKSQPFAPSERVIARKRQIKTQFTDLQEYYLRKRRHWAKNSRIAEERVVNPSNSSGYYVGLENLQSVLTSCTRYSQLRVVSELRCSDFFHSANIVSSIEFDRDNELFATAGVSRRIKVFEYSSVVNEPTQVHCAVVDIATRSKLSCLSWNKYAKQCIASTDYDGIVTVWDVNTNQSVGEYEEHEKRAWSVDFSWTEPSLLMSGGDDCKVKVWSTKQEGSVLTINMNANICSVKCNPGSSVHVAVGSADHHVYYYDLRNISQPVCVFSGHRKAVSYVKFLTSHELASASTDSTLRLWDVNEYKPLQIYRGHTNEKNFVGLTGNTEYLSCGSETNELFVYHKAISRPIARYRFSAADIGDTDDDRGQYFVSAVCWKSDSPIIMAANSRGNIKVLGLTA